MKKQHIVSKPTSLRMLSFDKLYEDISSQWELKAEHLIARRMRKLKQHIRQDTRTA